MRILLVGHHLEGNAVGRAYCLWLVARHLGHDCRVLGVEGQSLWPPLAQTDLAADVVSADLLREARWADVVVAVKPYPGSAGPAQDVAERLGKGFVLDVDDPDVEIVRARIARLTGVRQLRARAAARRLLAGMERVLADPRPRAVITSNPVLQRRYGGVVVPHARVPPPDVQGHREGSPQVAFVGTLRRHKGMDGLREAVAALAPDGWTLSVTADAPPDARPWERWHGRTTLQRGLDLVASCDVVVVPSLRGPVGDAQLPVKLVDAMMAGRAVVATDLEPVRWALDGSGVLVRDGSVAALTDGLSRLTSRAARAEAGGRARARALALASPAACAAAFSEALDAAGGRPRA